MLKQALATALVAAPFGLLAAGTASAQTPVCEVDRPVVFAGLDWDSSYFHNAVAGFILEHGYGCGTETSPGSTIPLLNAMARGAVDITMEMWIPNVRDVWDQAVARGRVVEVGVNFPDATQKWYVPKYLVEGDDAPAAGLTSVEDLAKYKDVFADPEEPDKGRFFNCILGWGCEVINTKKLHAYGLDDSYTNVRPGTGAALSAAIESHIQRNQPIVFYYWGPTWVLGKFADRIVALDEPDYDPKIWSALIAASNPEDVDKATAYPLVEVSIAVSTEFQEVAPKIVEFLSNYQTTNEMVSEALAYMRDNNATADEAAIHFLQQNPDIWTGWVPDEVAATVKTALEQT
ncbi:ABC transporter substrate-binding protein [Amorphus orientalis]|uniref:Glycine betaine/proline transport system substrate-binding protein n=1 Tax=Amorphus orientalis TaxID=649198 RepID=A0AAE3VLE4_9HYPH|nr:ABC transporter substrate-binding protein [Amorphus orientalis]MDQ0314058.1 glycine betaine/proline transport system substrate-binding protein [Amorphus orientalis]